MGKQAHLRQHQVVGSESAITGKHSAKSTIAKGFVATSVILGTFTPQVMANTAGTANQQIASVNVDGTALSKPFIAVRSDAGVVTTYVPMYYVNQALAKAGYKAAWDGNTHTWALSTSLTNLDFSNVSLGTGNTTITINGQAVKKINTFAQHDPATGKASGQTVYIPIYYVDVLFNAAGISGMWDGSKHSWTLTTPLNLETNATYGPTTGTQEVNRNINVLGTNVTIQNATVTGNVYVNPGANGEVYMKNVKVSGAIVVLSGAPHSIHLSNVVAPQLVINSTSAVHVVTEGSTAISSTQVGAADQEAVTLEQQSGSLGNVTVTAKQAVTLTGTQPFTNVNVQGTGSLTVGSGATVKAISVSVSNAHVTVSAGANVSTVNVANVTDVTLDNDGSISTLQNQAPSNNGVTITGQGTVTTTMGTAPTTGTSGQTSTGGGVPLPPPPTPAPTPTSSVSVESITPKPGLNLNGTATVDFSVVINYTSVIDSGTVTAELVQASGKSFTLGAIPVHKGSGQVTVSKTGVAPADLLASFADSNQQVYLAIGLKDANGNYDGTWQQLTQYSYDLSTPSTTLPALSAPTPQVSGMNVTWRGNKFACGYVVKVYSGSTVVDQLDTGASTSADLSKRNLPSGDYTVTVSAEGDNVTYGNSPESSPVAVTINALDAPANVQTDAKVPLAVDWDPVSTASSYLVRVYDETGTNLLASTGTDATSQNIADLGLPGGKYKVCVVAEGNDSTVADSVESTPFDFTMVALADPVPTISGMTVSWATIDGATGYDVIVHDANGVLDVEPVDASTTSFDLSQPGYPAGDYTVGVVAKGDNKNAVDSSEGMADGTVTMNPVPTPTNVVVTGTMVTWDAVTGAAGYRVGLMDAKGNLIDVSPDLSSSTTQFDVSTFGDEYKLGDVVSVMALGDGATTSNSSPSEPVLVNALATPMNVVTDGTDVMWDPVTGATGYKVDLTDGSGAIIEESPVLSSTTTDFNVKTLGNYTPGDYVTVTAVGDGTTTLDSKPSDPILVNPLDVPGNVVTAGTTLMWDPVQNAVGYEVALIDGAGNLVGQATIDPATTEYDVSQITGYQAGDYALVYAMGDGLNYSDSADSTAVLINPLDIPQNVGLLGTDLIWDAVPNAAAYVVVLLDSKMNYVAEAQTTDTGYDLTQLGYKAGDHARVFAVGDGTTYSDSDDSTTLLVNPLPAPVATANGTIVSWAPVPNATGYTVRIYSSTTYNLAVDPITVNTTSFDLATLNLPADTYTVLVVANGDQKTYSDSDVSNQPDVVIQ